MSPARSKRQPIPHRRSRTDIVKAVGVAVGIVFATAVFIWLMRPGPQGIPATGGLMNRQPRASWLVGSALGIAAFVTWWILRGSRRARARAKLWLPVSLGVVLAAAVGGGVAWPGGLLRHDIAPAPAPKTPPTSVPITKAGSSTTISRTSTSAGSSTTAHTSTPGLTATTTATGPTTSPSTTGSP